MTANEKRAEELVNKVKDLVKKGNVSRVRVTRKGEVLVNIPLNVGIIGGVVGIAAAPWAMLIGVIAGAGLDCKIEVEMNDGDIVDIIDN